MLKKKLLGVLGAVISGLAAGAVAPVAAYGEDSDWDCVIHSECIGGWGTTELCCVDLSVRVDPPAFCQVIMVGFCIFC